MSRIIIFEGADGSGKSTLAKKVATSIGAKYVHFGPLPQVKKGLARMYVEAALPALLGYQDVVFDRSWLSETPYGNAFRGGSDRLGFEARRMLERIFMRCQTSLVLCDPGFTAVAKTFLSRKGEEYLESLDQLGQVHKAYEHIQTSLPMNRHDYTRSEFPSDVNLLVATTAHKLSESAGNATARTLVVGENYAPLTDTDSFYQKPFCAFSGAGCSRWLTNQLEIAGIGEERLVWLNADNLIKMTRNKYDDVFRRVTKIIALGAIAASACRELQLPNVVEVEHPQSWKRFKYNEPYPIQEALK